MSTGPNIAFFGTSNFSVHILESLERENLLPSLIVTAPDTRSGRKLLITPSPVKIWATERNIQVIQPESLKEIPQKILDQSWDLFVVVAYGRILPKNLLDIPERGTLNVHPSLLPKFRGASPIQSAILNDEKETGVTVMLLDEKMDHGPIVTQASVSIEDLPNGESGWPPSFKMLEELLASVGGELLAETILPWLNGDIKEEEQRHDLATYVEKIQKIDGLLDLKANPYENYLKIQAFGDWPGTYFFVDLPADKEGKSDKKMRVKIASASYENNTLTIKSVVPEGKKEMNYEDFNRSLK